MRDGNPKNLNKALDTIKKRYKGDRFYDVNDDNLGFGKWLAYQIGI